MKTFTSFLNTRWLLLCLGLLVAPAIGWAEHDHPCGADEVECGETISGTTVGATFDEVGTCGTTNTAPGVWYIVEGTGGVITVSTCDQASYDTKLSVFTNACDDTAVCIGGNDDGAGCSGFSSEFSFVSDSGTDYFILVHGFDDATGTFDLSVTCADPPPPNDACISAEDIECGDVVSGSTTNATFDNVGSCGTSNTAPGVWYSFTGTGGAVRFSTCSPNTNYDTKISVFTGICDELVCVDGNDDDSDCPSGILNSTVIVIPTTLGVVYRVLVHGFGGATGDFELSVECLPPPANDEPCSAIALTEGVPETVDNLTASADLGEVSPGAGTGSSTCDSQDGWCSFETEVQNSVWYTFTPDTDGCFDITVEGADLQLAVYTIGSCGSYGSYEEVAANDDGGEGLAPEVRRVELMGGETYYIQVDGFGGASTENGSIVVTEVICPCDPEDANAVLNLLADNFPAETFWEIRDLDGVLVATGDGAEDGYLGGELNEIPLCIDTKECYEFTIFDRFGDGICCGFGNGNWSIVDLDGNTLAASPTGGNFGASETVDFSTGQRRWDCPDDFEVFTNQFICQAYVDVPLPSPRSECVVLIEGRVRPVNPETLGNIPGEGWSSWSTDLSGYYEPGVYKVRWRSTDVSDFRKSCTFYFTVSEVLPCPWIQLPDGIGCEDGNSASFEDGVFTLNSVDCHNPTTTNTDEYAFVQQTLCGDGSITAQVTSLTGNALGWAGITMRESGNFGPSPTFVDHVGNDADTKSVTLLTNRTNRHRTEVRLQDGGPVTASQTSSFGRHWLRLVRSGPNFTGYVSSNGITWIYKFSIQIDMDPCIEIGMVLNSQWSTGDQTATFENVEVTGGGLAPIQAITDGQDDAQLGDRGNRLVLRDEAQQAPRSFTAYPNPTTGLTTLAISDFIDDTAQLEVINTFGQVVLQRNIGVVDRSTEALDLTALPAGVYTIRLLLADGESEMVQVVKQ